MRKAVIRLFAMVSIIMAITFISGCVSVTVNQTNIQTSSTTQTRASNSATIATSTKKSTISSSNFAENVYELVIESGNAIPVNRTITDFNSWIKTTNKPILVDFWADWCAPCRAAAPFIESLATEYAGKAHIVKIDVDKETKLAKEYNATSIPLFVIIKDGVVVTSLAGYSSARDNQIRDALNKQIKP